MVSDSLCWHFFEKISEENKVICHGAFSIGAGTTKANFITLHDTVLKLVHEPRSLEDIGKWQETRVQYCEICLAVKRRRPVATGANIRASDSCMEALAYIRPVWPSVAQRKKKIRDRRAQTMMIGV
jgi:hypothetical protein